MSGLSLRAALPSDFVDGAWRGRCVVLVDPQWTGHHPLYFKAFAEGLCDLGCNVFGICPEPDEMRSALPGEHGERVGKRFLPWSPTRFNFRPRRLSIPLNAQVSHWWLSRRLSSLEQEIGSKVDLVFFTCLYDWFLARHLRSFAWDWAGLYLQVSGFRIRDVGTVHPLRRFDSVKTSRGRLRGLGVLDEDAVDYVRQVSGCDNVRAFPDFSDTTVSPESLIAERLNRQANGQKVVGVAGHLIPSKGITTLAEAAIALAAENRNVVVAFVGEFWWESFDENARRTLRQAFALPNVFTHLERIPSEPDFNAVLNRFDVIYAGYHAFPHSSNMPAKAAGLGKPLIVSSGYVLAERTERHALGKVIPERDVDALREAILELIHGDCSLPSSVGCQDYLNLHSRQGLGESLRSLLNPIWH